MTQYQLTPLPAYAGHTISVGWQAGSRTPTFYASAVNLSGDDCPDDCPAHVTAPIAPDIITDAATVVDLVRPYAEIPGHLLASLKADQAHHTTQPRDGDPAAWQPSAAVHDHKITSNRPAADQLADMLRTGTAEQAAETLRDMHAHGPTNGASLVMALMLAQALRDLDDAQLGEMGHGAMCGVAIVTSTEAHFAIDTPAGFVTAAVKHPGATLREILAAIGYGPDRYAYRDYGDNGRALLFCLTPA